MTRRADITETLSGGDRRSIGRANEVAEIAKTDPCVFSQLIDGMAGADPVIAMRCADAAEKATRARPGLLVPHKPQLLKLLAEATQPELRWHIAALVPRMPLTPVQSRKAFARMLDYTRDRSSIVRTSAMQALHDLALGNAGLRQEALLHLKELTATGSPAMRARGKRLIDSLGHAA